MSDETTTYVFVSRPALLPTGVQAAYPGASFLARAHQAGAWGILISVPRLGETADPSAAEHEAVTTDDGRTVLATIVPPDAAADPAAILAAAKYWELPPAFVATLAR